MTILSSSKLVSRVINFTPRVLEKKKKKKKKNKKKKKKKEKTEWRREREKKSEDEINMTNANEFRIVGHAVANDLTSRWHAMGVDSGRRFGN